MITFQKIDFASDIFDEALTMRYKVLREPLGLDYTEEDITLESGNDHFVMMDGAKVIAYCQMKDLGEGISKMRQVAVDRDYQGKSIGKEMVSYVEAWASLEGFKMIELHARDTAVPFYLKANYIISKEPFEEVGIPHRYMSKRL
jgi:hypothetical protein